MFSCWIWRNRCNIVSASAAEYCRIAITRDGWERWAAMATVPANLQLKLSSNVSQGDSSLTINVLVLPPDWTVWGRLKPLGVLRNEPHWSHVTRRKAKAESWTIEASTEVRPYKEYMHDKSRDMIQGMVHAMDHMKDHYGPRNDPGAGPDKGPHGRIYKNNHSCT